MRAEKTSVWVDKGETPGAHLIRLEGGEGRGREARKL